MDGLLLPAVQKIRDGTSNTILVGEDSRSSGAPRLTDIKDGTSNTFFVGESTGAATRAAIQDGTSNTILFAEKHSRHKEPNAAGWTYLILPYIEQGS